MEGIKLIPSIILLIAIAGIIAGASSIVMSKFGDSMTKCFNDSYVSNGTYCSAGLIEVGSIGKDGLNITDEYFTRTVSIEGITTIAEQVPTVAIIAIMVIIISIIAGVFAYMRLFG